MDPSEQLDEDVKDTLLQLTDDFVDRLIADSCRLAKHRKSASLDARDVKLALGTLSILVGIGAVKVLD